MRRSLLLPLLALVGCSGGEQPQTLDGLDNELTDIASANAADPVAAAALHDPIMVDPGLAQQANADAVRPPPRPDPGAVPVDLPLTDPAPAAGLRHAPAPAGDCRECKAPALTLGALAARHHGGCAAVAYSFGWANRLPAALPLYPGARVIEAAGNDTGGCGLRVVSFASAAAPAKLVDWYFTRVTAAGYSAEQRVDGPTRLLGGTQGDAAYMLYASPRAGGGTDADLVVAAR